MIKKLDKFIITAFDNSDFCLVEKESLTELYYRVESLIEHVNELEEKINKSNSITVKVASPIKHQLPYSAGMFGTVTKRKRRLF